MPAVHAECGRASGIAAASGLTYRSRANGKSQGEGAVLGYDLDDDRDILVSAHNMMPWMPMCNEGDGRFVAVQAGRFRRRDRHGCVAGDFGSVGGAGLPDGRPDLYCIQAPARAPAPSRSPTSYGCSARTGRSSTWPRRGGVDDPNGRDRETVLLDFDRDRLLDLVIGNETPSIYPPPDRLFRNLGGGFAEIVDPAITHEIGSPCMEPGDIDGDPNIHVVQGDHARRPDVMLINDGGRHFHTTPIPPVRVGDGNAAIAIPDREGTGHATFLVTKGRVLNPGPIQSITSTGG